MIPPPNPSPAGALTCAVANVPRLAETLDTVGSGPRWYGLATADAGGLDTMATDVSTPNAMTAAVVTVPVRLQDIGDVPSCWYRGGT